MPIIEVLNIPPIRWWARKKLLGLRGRLEEVALGNKELELKKDGNVICTFQSDPLRDRKNPRIVVKLLGISKRPERTRKMRTRLAAEIGTEIQILFPNAFIQVLEEVPSDVAERAYWTSGDLKYYDSINGEAISAQPEGWGHRVEVREWSLPHMHLPYKS